MKNKTPAKSRLLPAVKAAKTAAKATFKPLPAKASAKPAPKAPETGLLTARQIAQELGVSIWRVQYVARESGMTSLNRGVENKFTQEQAEVIRVKVLRKSASAE